MQSRTLHTLHTLFSRQPLYAPLLPLVSLPSSASAKPSASATTTAAASTLLTPPTLQQLNELAAQQPHPVLSGGGKPLRFVLPHGSGLSYEERVWWLGEVETRPDNWHDAFNALVWLTFPHTKAALNQRHHQVLAEQRQRPAAAPAPHPQPSASTRISRGPLRDAATQFDECGAIVIASDPALWQAICEHRWKDVFWTARAQVQATMRVFIVGHASYDLLRQPHLGLCAKAVFLHVSADWLQLPLAEQLVDADQRIARRFHHNNPGGYRQPRDFQPLPLLGIPGATPENEVATYYDNTRQFRPARVTGKQGVAAATGVAEVTEVAEVGQPSRSASVPPALRLVTP